MLSAFVDDAVPPAPQVRADLARLQDAAAARGAAEALQLGLVHAVVPREQLMDAARERANLIAANAPLAVSLTKRAAYRSWDLDVDTALELAASYQGMVQNTDDHKEAVDAILGKRAPDFKGQ